ncbi:MAG TPA: nucleotidyltransferase family protein [Gemmatimonadaceae bacterium]|nr:nucleotidyltransferase family protein [Gemmatimonadaceae bacterium]
MSIASAIHDLLSSAVRREQPGATVLRRASDADASWWRRVLRYERCGPAVWGWMLDAGHALDLPAHVRALLKDDAQLALGQSLRVAPQLARIAMLAARCGVRVMALKGAARLLAGAHTAASRTMDDIDLLVDDRAGAELLHRALQCEMGYAVVEHIPGHHHLDAIALPGWLPVEIHTRLARRHGADGARVDIWQDAREVEVGGAPVWLPSPAALAEHTLAHATASRMLRYTLRDVIDVAAVVSDPQVDLARVSAFVHASVERRAMETLLGAAHVLDARVPAARVPEASWRAVRRVGRLRAEIAVRVQGRHAARRLIAAGGALAEGSPRAVIAYALARR